MNRKSINIPVITDWASCDADYDISGTTVTAKTGFYKFEGDTILLRYKFTINTIDPASPNITVGLPFGLNSDETKMVAFPGESIVGSVQLKTSSNFYAGVVVSVNSTKFGFAGPADGYWKPTIPAIFLSGNLVSVNFSVPINGKKANKKGFI